MADSVSLRPGDVQVLEEFYSHLVAGRGLSEHTGRAYYTDIASLLAELPAVEGAEERTDLHEFDPPMLRSWLAELTRQARARATLARRSAAARAITAWCHSRGRHAAEPAQRLLAPRPDSVLPAVLPPSDIDQALTFAAEEAQRLRQEGDSRAAARAARDWAIVEMLYATGVRVSELAGLNRADVDPGTRLVRVLGKGGAERMVPYGAPAQRALEAWLEVREEFATARSAEALFLGARGGRFGVRGIRQRVQALMVAAGVPEDSPRELRPSAATHLHEGGG